MLRRSTGWWRGGNCCRTPSAQAKDLERDQAHTAAGYTRLRFSHWQVKHERDYVKRILGETAARLRS